MKRSIRWTLLGWYAGILVLVIGTLVTILHQQQKRAVLAEAGAVLETHAHAIANAIELDEHDGYEVEIRGGYRKLTLPGIVDPSWFAAWAPNGSVLVRSPSTPESVRGPPTTPVRTSQRWDALLVTADDVTVLTGRRMDSVYARIRAFGWVALADSLGALFLALLGGWLLVRHVLRPIDRMTETASRITAVNLGERIDVGKTESELGQLAATLNAALDRLEEAVERQMRFTADASHELRTPLSVILASTEWALRRERSPAEYVESVEATQRAAVRMRGLVEDLLLLARSDAGAIELRLEDVDLSALLEEAAGYVAPLARERGVTVVLRGEPSPLRADPERLRAVAIVLLANAVRHAAPEGRIQVASGVGNGRAWFEIEDDGEGIPEEHLPHVFERFYRADDARSADAGGIGLGLAIAKRLVELHGGTIAARSRLGGGAVFRVELPRLARPA